MKRKKFKHCCAARLHAKHKLDCIFKRETISIGDFAGMRVVTARKTKSAEMKVGDLAVKHEAVGIGYIEPVEFRRAANEFFKDAIIALDFIVLFSFLALIGVGIILFG